MRLDSRLVGTVLEARRKQSEDGLRDVQNALSEKLPESFFEAEHVTLYVTGSFGRLEGRYDRSEPDKGSDLDVFFMYMPPDRSKCELSKLTWFRLIAAVIDVADELRFKPFSKDGAFLKAHNVFHVGSELGSSNEDAENGFTARLLLLLEGRPLAGEQLFDQVLLETIGFYFRDFANNRKDFRPHALINDILRYWRTLCLNYEHRREARRAALDETRERIEADGELDDDAKQVRTEEAYNDFRMHSALDNIKLRHSRLALCFSMVAPLASHPDGITPEGVRELCRTVPSDRWALAAERDPTGRAAELVPVILGSYETFLDFVADTQCALESLREQEDRRRLRGNADVLGDNIAELLRCVASESQFRRLLV